MKHPTSNSKRLFLTLCALLCLYQETGPAKVMTSASWTVGGWRAMLRGTPWVQAGSGIMRDENITDRSRPDRYCTDSQCISGRPVRLAELDVLSF